MKPSQSICIIAMLMAGSCTSPGLAPPASAIVASPSTPVTRLASLLNIGASLNSVIESISTLILSIDKLITTGREAKDRTSANALVGRLTQLSNATTRTFVSQLSVMNSMDEYLVEWEPESAHMDSSKRAQLEGGWEQIRARVLAARSAISELDNILEKESGKFGRDESYQQLYAAVVARRDLLNSISLDGPGILTASEVDALRKVLNAYSTLHKELGPVICKLKTYISNLEAVQSKGPTEICEPSATPSGS